MFKEGSIVRLKENSCYLQLPLPKWTRGSMIYKRIAENVSGAKTDHLGQFACHKKNLGDYWFIAESELKVVEKTITQLTIFDF